jgi:hypothetical protein
MNEVQGTHPPFTRRVLDAPPGPGPVPAAASPGVLVIDPDEAVRAAFSGWLLQQGFAVWTVADQEEALAVYRQHRSTIALVVEDLRTYWLPHAAPGCPTEPPQRVSPHGVFSAAGSPDTGACGRDSANE